MKKRTFEIDYERMKKEIADCTTCGECYVEQIWRDIGRTNNCHCSAVKDAIRELDKNMSEKHGIDKLPPKDVYVCITLKGGKHICVKLFYDDEAKPCLWYDDFNNWYSMKDVESWVRIPAEKIGKLMIEVEDPEK